MSKDSLIEDTESNMSDIEPTIIRAADLDETQLGTFKNILSYTNPFGGSESGIPIEDALWPEKNPQVIAEWKARANEQAKERLRIIGETAASWLRNASLYQFTKSVGSSAISAELSVSCDLGKLDATLEDPDNGAKITIDGENAEDVKLSILEILSDKR